VTIPANGAEGVLLAHGDATCGYALYLQDGRLHHTINIGGALGTVSSDEKIPPGHRTLGVRVRQGPEGRTFTLAVDGRAAGELKSHLGFALLIAWSGLDIGRDRASPVGPYAAPFEFTGKLRRVVVTMDEDQVLDGEGIGEAEMARQ
jgi:arylsulfatase